MRQTDNRGRWRGLGAILAGLIGCWCPAVLRADSITLDNKVQYNKVDVQTVKDQQFLFSIGGRDISKPVAQIAKINIDGEPALNLAEEAFATRDWDKATEGYEKTLRTTNKAWLKDWCSLRLLESANRAGRFDSAVKAYVALAEKSPEGAKAIVLTMPKSDSTYLPQAIGQVKDAVARIQDNNAKALLLKLLGDLYTAKGDMQGAQDAAQKLVELKALTDPNSPDALRAAVLLKLRNLHSALANKEYDKVIQGVYKDANNILDPADQADAMLCLADAKAGKAANSADAEVWKDVAVAYMRVVANAPANAPQVVDALLKAAAIHARHLEEPKTAAEMYKRIQTDYKGTEAAQQAEQELSKLN